jgi:hypothetical protein
LPPEIADDDRSPPKPSPVSQILFGTDHPAEPIPTTTDPLAQLGLLAKDLPKIDRGSAERLFPRLKREEHSEVKLEILQVGFAPTERTLRR